MEGRKRRKAKDPIHVNSFCVRLVLTVSTEAVEGLALTVQSVHDPSRIAVLKACGIGLLLRDRISIKLYSLDSEQSVILILSHNSKPSASSFFRQDEIGIWNSESIFTRGKQDDQPYPVQKNLLALHSLQFLSLRLGSIMISPSSSSHLCLFLRCQFEMVSSVLMFFPNVSTFTFCLSL